MLPLETCSKVFNLPNHPAISHVNIGQGYFHHQTSVTIFSNDDADQSEVLDLVNNIFPDCKLSNEQKEYERLPGAPIMFWNRFTGSVGEEYELIVNHYETKKDLPKEEGTKETIHPEFTTELTPEQILEMEG